MKISKDGEKLEEVEVFSYLGHRVNSDICSEKEELQGDLELSKVLGESEMHVNESVWVWGYRKQLFSTYLYR